MSKARKEGEQPEEQNVENVAVPLGQGHYRVTLIPEDFEISPALSANYAVGQETVADRASDGDYFVGGHPIKGRNG